MKEDFYKGVYANTYRTAWSIYPKILRKINLKKSDKVLDAGCGNGELGKYLREFNLTGIDFNKKSVEEARKTKRYKKVIDANIYNLPFIDKEFDETVSIEVFQYLKDPEKAFSEIKRVTKKRIIISSANYRWFRIKVIFSKAFRRDYKRMLEHENMITDVFFKKIAKDHNLKLELKYISNKFDFLRNLFGKFFASEIIGVFTIK